MIKNFFCLLSFNFPRKPNPDKPELTIEYSIANIQLSEDGENIPI